MQLSQLRGTAKVVWKGGIIVGFGGEWFSVALAVSLGRCVLPLNAYLRSGVSDGVRVSMSRFAPVLRRL